MQQSDLARGGYSIFEETMADTTCLEWEAAARAGAVALWALGVIEPHGPHLPLATDVYLPAVMLKLVRRLLERRGVPAVGSRGTRVRGTVARSLSGGPGPDGPGNGEQAGPAIVSDTLHTIGLLPGQRARYDPPFPGGRHGMDEALQVRLTALGDEVRAAAIADGPKHAALWCVGQLPALYAKFRRTNETRYGDEITRLVRAALHELAQSRRGCPEAKSLAARITDHLRLLHEEFGLPRLALGPRGVPSPRSRKAGRSEEEGKRPAHGGPEEAPDAA